MKEQWLQSIFCRAWATTARVTRERPPMARLLGISWKKRIWVTTAMMMAVDLAHVTHDVTLCHVTADLSTSATAPAFSSLRARMPRLTWLRHITPAEGMIITTGN